MDDYAAFALCFTGPSGGPVPPGCAAGDFDGDRDVDCEDWSQFVVAWTAPAEPPALEACWAPVPAISQGGILLLALLTLGGGVVVLWRRSWMPLTGARS